MSGKNRKPKKPDGRKISKRLNPRQRRFVAEFTNPESEAFGNQTKAAKLAGYSELSPGQAGHQLVKNTEVRREIERVLDEAGATQKKMAEVLKSGLEAKTIRVFCPKDGKLVYSKPLEDYPTQVRAAEVVGKLRGDFPTTHEQERVALLQIQQNILLVPPVKPKPDVIEIEGTVEE
ncbi:MAG: terminase small subunit [Nitrospiraceae bacterium]